MGLMDRVTTKAPSLPSRVYLYAQEKWGKTSWACHAPKPIFVMTQGETGLLSLLESGGVPETAHFPDDAKDWDEFVAYVKAVRDEPHDRKALVIDTANGAEALLQAWVLANEFDGRTGGKQGFNSYGAGDKACVRHWDAFLDLLDDIRLRRNMSIVLLAHSKIRQASNPLGDDYDQIRPEGVEKLWGKTHKWADVIAAGAFRHVVKDDKVAQKSDRVLYTSDTPAAVAGNRYSLPPVIACGGDAKTSFGNFARALSAAKARGKQADPAPQPEAKRNPPPAEPTAPAPAPAAPDGDPEPEEAPADGRCTPNQLEAVNDLLGRLGWKLESSKTLGWINAAVASRLTKPADVTDLTDDQAFDLIEALESQLAATNP
jgi:hypothetical protein